MGYGAVGGGRSAVCMCIVAQQLLCFLLFILHQCRDHPSMSLAEAIQHTVSRTLVWSLAVAAEAGKVTYHLDVVSASYLYVFSNQLYGHPPVFFVLPETCPRRREDGGWVGCLVTLSFLGVLYSSRERQSRLHVHMCPCTVHVYVPCNEPCIRSRGYHQEWGRAKELRALLHVPRLL